MSSTKPRELVGHPVPFTDARDHGFYLAAGIGVRDGDTAVALLDLGFRFYPIQALRLEGIDCPETVGGTAGEREHGQEAKARAAELVTGSYLLIWTPGKRMSFDRFIARVFVHGYEGQATGVREVVADLEWTRLADILRHEGYEKRESYE